MKLKPNGRLSNPINEERRLMEEAVRKVQDEMPEPTSIADVIEDALIKHTKKERFTVTKAFTIIGAIGSIIAAITGIILIVLSQQ
jgi:hypothetical protein